MSFLGLCSMVEGPAPGTAVSGSGQHPCLLGASSQWQIYEEDIRISV